MAKYTETITGTEGEAVFSLYNVRKPISPIRTLFVHGELGGGTVTWELSFDGGETWQEETGDNITVATDDRAPTLLRATLAGASDADVTVGFSDMK